MSWVRILDNYARIFERMIILCASQIASMVIMCGCYYGSSSSQRDCVESNPISKRQAEKAGFKFFKDNDVYWFDI